MQNLYAQIIIEKKNWPKGTPLDYKVPLALQDKLCIGHKVLVPLQNRRVYGLVIRLSAVSDVKQVRNIISLAGDFRYFTENLLELAYWMSDYYFCTLSQALSALLPSLVNEQRAAYWGLNFPVSQLDMRMQKEKLTPKQKTVLNLIARHNFCFTAGELAKRAGTTVSPLKCLVKKGLVTDQKPRPKETLEKPLVLNDRQAAVLEKLQREVRQPQGQVYLLHGVTGSGKTEIYLQLIDYVLKLGKQAIVLVPEIALTPQTVTRFRRRFGEAVAVLHSHLSSGERFTQWSLIKTGRAKIAIGARSALFAPFAALGLIIIDEEHEFTYKQEENPKYHARDTAIKRAQIEKAAVLLGSATPSLESFYRAKKGLYGYLALPERIGKQPLPEVRVVDMCQQLKNRNKSVLSLALRQAIEERLTKGEQIILFLNRRGFATFVNCRECGLVLTCPNCNVSLTYHQQEQKLSCHYCNYQERVPTVCPRCQSKYIRYFGTGTEKVEEAVQKFFPQARILRMDRDTTGRKQAHAEILNAFTAGRADILLGTQMIAKGLDIPNVTLVGVITADTLLNLPDFRAAEKTFQLLTQVAGRAGRGEKLGQVIIQTYDPNHYSIKAAKAHDYFGFYAQEIDFRQEVGYPPFAYLARIVLKAREEEAVIKQGERLLGELTPLVCGQEILGPVPAPVSRVKGYFRWQILIKDRNIKRLNGLLKKWQESCHYASLPLGMMIDIEPVSML